MGLKFWAKLECSEPAVQLGLIVEVGLSTESYSIVYLAVATINGDCSYLVIVPCFQMTHRQSFQAVGLYIVAISSCCFFLPIIITS